jgi:hypothetical protein
MTISTDWIGAKVKVAVGRATVGVDEGGGIGEAVSVTGEMTVSAGGGITNGVAVTMLGVEDGIAVHTGKG